MLPDWSEHNVWRWLFTFYDAKQLEEIQKAWVLNTQDSKRPKTLHLVACLSPQQGQEFDLDNGFHRIEACLDAPQPSSQVLLTLCVGQITSTLKELEFEADVVSLDITATPWSRWEVQALTRCCRRGTQVWVRASPERQQTEPSIWALLSQAGFVENPKTDHRLPIERKAEA